MEHRPDEDRVGDQGVRSEDRLDSIVDPCVTIEVSSIRIRMTVSIGHHNTTLGLMIRSRGGLHGFRQGPEADLRPVP